MERDNLAKVNNIILYTNPNLKKSKFESYDSNLGTFKVAEKYIEDYKDIVLSLTLDTHHRVHYNCSTEPMHIGDNIFYYRSIKGSGLNNPLGYLSKKDGGWTVNSHTEFDGDESEVPEIVFKNTSKEYEWGYEILGALDKRVIVQMVYAANLMNESGVRAEFISSYTQLNEIIYKGKVTSIDKLKENNIIPNDNELELVQLERFFRNPYRIKDFVSMLENEQKEVLIEVFHSLNKEKELLSIGEGLYDIDNFDLSVIQYSKETVKNLSKNLAIMFSKGYFMSYYNSGNITMSAGELVDLDSLSYTESKKYWGIHEGEKKWLGVWSNNYELPAELEKDIRDCSYAINMLLKKLNIFIDIDGIRGELSAIFISTFEENFVEKKFNKIYKKEDLFKGIKGYSKKTIGNGRGQPMININK